MNKLSKRLIIIGLASICLWVIGGILLFQEKNGKMIILITAIIIMAGFRSQIIKERKLNS